MTISDEELERLAAPLRANSVLSIGWLPAQMMARELLAARKVVYAVGDAAFEGYLHKQHGEPDQTILTAFDAYLAEYGPKGGDAK